MESTNELKALFIVVNAGFADEVVDIAREVGVKGATILNARGGGATHKSLMGITVDHEKEMVLTLVSAEIAGKVMAVMKAKAGMDSPASGVCFVLPIEKATGITSLESKESKPEK